MSCIRKSSQGVCLNTTSNSPLSASVAVMAECLCLGLFTDTCVAGQSPFWVLFYYGYVAAGQGSIAGQNVLISLNDSSPVSVYKCHRILCVLTCDFAHYSLTFNTLTFPH
jgi:hypothetical protein